MVDAFDDTLRSELLRLDEKQLDVFDNTLEPAKSESLSVVVKWLFRMILRDEVTESSRLIEFVARKFSLV